MPQQTISRRSETEGTSAMSEYQFGTQGQQQPVQQPVPQQSAYAQQQQEAVNLAERQMRVRQANAGKRFCRNCGGEIQSGASVCVHCNTVLNPVAIRRAQEIVMDRQAKVTREMLIKSFLRPRKGMKLYKQYIDRRPQVAMPCKKAAIIGRIVRGVVIGGAVAFFLFTQLYPYF